MDASSRQKHSRIIQELKWARRCYCPPKALSQNKKLKGSRAKGKTYERKVIKDFSRQKLPGIFIPSPWFSFADRGGLGWCQPDFLVELANFIVIGEIKLTQTSSAWAQLKLLYKPVVEMALGKPCYLLQICKGLRWENSAKISSIEEFIDKPRNGLWTLHYLP